DKQRHGHRCDQAKDETNENAEKRTAPGSGGRFATFLCHDAYILSGAPTPSKCNPLASTWRVAVARRSRARWVAVSSTSIRLLLYQVWKSAAQSRSQNAS